MSCPAYNSQLENDLGHFYNTITGVGKNRKEAETRAIADFMYEHGHRHSVRGIEAAKMLRKVPPKKNVEEKLPAGHRPYGNNHTIIVRTVEDTDAPPEKWLEEWEFELHTHA